MSRWSRLVNVFRVDRVSREIDEELRSHLAEAIEEGRDPAKRDAPSGRCCASASRAATFG